jgi:amidase
MAELHDLTALEQGEAIRRHEISPVELVDHDLNRIAEYGEALGAYVTVTADAARAAAAEAEAVVRAGAGTGPLDGIPIAIKDLTLTAGVRTTFGSAAFADFVPPIDADVVVLMRQAGLISLGKTTTSEFGCSLHA